MNKTNDSNDIPKVIDIHRHMIPNPVELVDERVKSIISKKIRYRKDGKNSVSTNHGISSIIYADLMNEEAQVRCMKEANITKSLLSFNMLLEILCDNLTFMSETDLAKTLNTAMADYVRKYPDMFEFMAIVNPFNKDSIEICEYCFNELGAKGINISSSWKGEHNDSRNLDYFWEYVQDKDQTIFIHPPLVPKGYEGMNIYKFEEMLSRPFDYTTNAAKMIYSGVFDRYPRLRVVVPHMASCLLNIVGRLDFGYRLGYDELPKEQRPICKNTPSYYFRKNLYTDTMGFSASGIRHTIETFGIDRVMFGTDYAAVPISPKEHIDIVKSLGLSKEDEEKILWKNASELFNISL